METIFAISSGSGKAGVCIFRISGEQSFNVLDLLLGDKKTSSLKPRKMYLRKIYHPQKKIVLDRALVVMFEKHKSFTGESLVEIHTHGSIALQKIISEILGEIPNIRLAKAGEFIRRAFFNEKLNLLEVEALSDLINAETSLQHEQAVSQMSGQLSKFYKKWRNLLIEAISNIEAIIDFPEEDIPTTLIPNVKTIIKELISNISKHVDDKNMGQILRTGIKLCILGFPNVGKSSLMNFLIGNHSSIVSSIPGTTRDVIEKNIDIGGIPIILQDTAGIRENTTDIIEKEGIKIAIKKALEAHINIIMFDVKYENLVPKNIKIFENIIKKTQTIFVLNKIDLTKNSEKKKQILEKNLKENCQALKKNPIIINISIKQQLNMEQLILSIEQSAKNLLMSDKNNLNSIQTTRERHKLELKKTISFLKNAYLEKDLVILSEHLRSAKLHIQNITGEITNEDVLKKIFSSFCIGK